MSEQAVKNENLFGNGKIVEEKEWGKVNRASETYGTPSSILWHINPRKREKRETTFEETMAEKIH